MDAEGLGHKLLLTPLATLGEPPEKQTVATVTAPHKILSLQALSSSFNAGTAKRGRLSRGKVLKSPPAVRPPERPRPFARYRVLTHGSAHRQLAPPLCRDVRGLLLSNIV